MYQRESLMSQTPEQGKNKDGKMKEPKIECTLILEKNKAKVGEFFAAEVIIKNISKEDFVIDYIAMPFYHLDLLILDPAGKKIPSRPYRNIFSIIDEGQLTLRPDESYRAKVDIFATSDDASWETLGTYKIIAVYEYKKEKAVSKQVELTLMPR